MLCNCVGSENPVPIREDSSVLRGEEWKTRNEDIFCRITDAGLVRRVGGSRSVAVRSSGLPYQCWTSPKLSSVSSLTLDLINYKGLILNMPGYGPLPSSSSSHETTDSLLVTLHDKGQTFPNEFFLVKILRKQKKHHCGEIRLSAFFLTLQQSETSFT